VPTSFWEWARRPWVVPRSRVSTLKGGRGGGGRWREEGRDEGGAERKDVGNSRGNG
jgi:hypothetical protein